MHKRLSGFWSLVIVGGALLCACSSTTTSGGTECDPDSRKVCVGLDDCQGEKRCGIDGKWGECLCGDASGGAAGNSGGGRSGAGGGSTSGGTAGDLGTGGNPGGAPSGSGGGTGGACAPQCNEARTGLEICDGSGSRTTEPCANEDPANCAVACDESGGIARCVHTAIDGDEDGYTSAACSPAPGDDCDDTTHAFSPGSTETCDGGRDNDCDGYPDVLDESIDMTSAPVRVRRLNAVNIEGLQRIDITWHVDHFFFVADDGNARSIYSGYADTNGTIALHDGVTLQSDSMNVYDSPRVTSLNGVLGMVARHDGYSPGGAQFAILNADGSVSSITGGIGGDAGDITPGGASFMLTAHDNPNASDLEYDFRFALGSTAGTSSDPLSKDNLAVTINHENAAYSGGVAAVVFTDDSGSEPSMQLMRITEGSIFGPTELARPAQMGDISALASGNLALAWATPAGFDLQVRRTDGTLVCDAAETSFGNGALDDFDSVAVEETGLGILVFAADSGGATGEGAVFVFDQSCRLISQGGKQVFNRFSVLHDLQQPYLPRIAVGGGYVAFAWSTRNSSDATDRRSWVRLVPEVMCQ